MFYKIIVIFFLLNTVNVLIIFMIIQQLNYKNYYLSEYYIMNSGIVCNFLIK